MFSQQYFISIHSRYTSQFGPMNDIIKRDGITFIKVRISLSKLSRLCSYHLGQNVRSLYMYMLFTQLNTVCHIRSHGRNSVESQAKLQLDTFLQQFSNNTSLWQETRATILLSHVPLKELPNYTLRDRIVQSLRPHYVFSGHVHHSDHQLHSRGSQHSGRPVEEFTVPTCSYRMGQMYMGVGVATIGKSNK